MFLKDLHTGAIRRVSMNAQGAQANRQSVAAALSGNGNVFSFENGKAEQATRHTLLQRWNVERASIAVLQPSQRRNDIGGAEPGHAGSLPVSSFEAEHHGHQRRYHVITQERGLARRDVLERTEWAIAIHLSGGQSIRGKETGWLLNAVAPNECLAFIFRKGVHHVFLKELFEVDDGIIDHLF